VIAVLCTDGVITVEYTMGTVNGDKFFDYVRGSLIPNMLPFDGTNPRSIAILLYSSCGVSSRTLQGSRDSCVVAATI